MPTIVSMPESMLARGCLLDTHLRNAGFDGFGHTSQFLDFLNQVPCLVYDLVGEALHVVRTGPGIDLAADIGLFLDVDLCVTCDAGRKVGRQRDRFVEGIGMQ